jgi:hypothetical protein
MAQQLLLPAVLCIETSGTAAAAAGIEEVVLVNDDELHVSCSMTLYSGKSCTYRQVFRRRV